MSQNIRATWASARHGMSWNVEGSGWATMSDSWIRLNPSMEEPSKPIPSANAPSSSCEVMVNDFRNPSTSVNQRRTKRIPRSSTVRSTYSASADGLTLTRLAAPCVAAVTRALTLPNPLGAARARGSGEAAR